MRRRCRTVFLYRDILSSFISKSLGATSNAIRKEASEDVLFEWLFVDLSPPLLHSDAKRWDSPDLEQSSTDQNNGPEQLRVLRRAMSFWT
ncbi:HET-C domain protein [Aspergillus luchuensis]|uniref:HET-C domain protein n=1 Tax=Aspergillus kawachii TaxID=1069201 RepID=A0A146F2D8_ASPKA|nr:HET-C domain protein [Aspergillus luchuensis]